MINSIHIASKWHILTPLFLQGHHWLPLQEWFGAGIEHTFYPGEDAVHNPGNPWNDFSDCCDDELTDFRSDRSLARGHFQVLGKNSSVHKWSLCIGDTFPGWCYIRISPSAFPAPGGRPCTQGVLQKSWKSGFQKPWRHRAWDCKKQRGGDGFLWVWGEKLEFLGRTC